MIALAFCLSALFLSGPAAGDTYHAELDPSQPGGLSGTIVNAPGALERVIAVEPFEMKAYDAKLDKDTGKFEFRGLPPGEYDLMIKSVGHMHEGVTLETDPEQSPSPNELKEMADGMASTLNPTEEYFDTKHLVRVTSDGRIGRAFMVYTRTRTTRHSNKTMFHGHIRRYALVEMMKTRDVWQIMTVRHLLRQEVPPDSADIKVEYHYSPDLGGLLVGEKMYDAGSIDLRKLTRVPDTRYGSAHHKRIWDDGVKSR